MYTVAGFVSETLGGGSSWEDLITQHIFAPLEMTDSTFTHRVMPEKEGHATPYMIIDSVLYVAPDEYFE